MVGFSYNFYYQDSNIFTIAQLYNISTETLKICASTIYLCPVCVHVTCVGRHVSPSVFLSVTGVCLSLSTYVRIFFRILTVLVQNAFYIVILEDVIL